MLDILEVCKQINFLHDRSVIIPVDNASNDYGIVCKIFYLSKMNFDDGNIIGNKVYKPIYREADYIYNFYEQKSSSTSSIQLRDINHYIHLLY